MNKTLYRWLTLAALLLLFSFASVIVSAQETAKIRFVHVTNGVGAVDIFINKTLAVENLEYGTTSLMLTVPAGEHVIDLTLADSVEPLITQTVTVSADRPTSFVVADGTAFIGVVENLNETSAAGSRLLLVHAIAGGPNVDIKLAEPVTLGGVEQAAGTAIATDMAFGTSFGAFDLPAQTYVVDVFVAGSEDAVLSEVTLPLAAGTSYTALVFGTPDEPSALLLSAMAQPGADAGLVRFVHGVVGSDNFEFYDGDTLIVPNLSAETATEHIALAAGEHAITIKVPGNDGVLSNVDIIVNPGEAQTVVAFDATGAVALSSYPDDISGVASNSTTAAVSVINAIVEGNLNEVTIAGDTVAEGITYATASEATTLAPTTGNVAFNVTIGNDTSDVDGEEVSLYGGTYYNLVAVSGNLNVESDPHILVFPTSISTTIGSAPSGGLQLATTIPAEATLPPAPTVAAALPTAIAAQPTAAAPVSDAITGRVLLDPGANLQLRQNPNADALSLGLAPSGTVLIVNGREGAFVALVDGQPEPPEAATFVDPVGLLPDEQTDLDPTVTWVNVTFNTPDGGQITAWVLAQFLDIRDGRGDKERLRDLEPIGGNIPGGASETAVTPPPIPTDSLTALVFNLDPGVALNIRRTPSTDGEVIGKVTTGTTLVYLGGSEDDQWAFVQYTTPEGGVIEGWVTVLYIQYTYNGKTYTLEDFKNIVSRLTSQALFEVIPSDRRGAVIGSVAPISVPTVDPLKDQFVATVQLDSGANLQLRRLPDPTSESLNLVASGTQLIITSRTELGDWLKVTFEGEEGWINSEFVRVTYNGATVSVDEIPVEIAQ